MAIEKEAKVINPGFSRDYLFEAFGASVSSAHCSRIVDTYLEPYGYINLKSGRQVRIRDIDGDLYLTVKEPCIIGSPYKKKEELEALITENVKEALLLMNRAVLKIEKNRYVLDYDGIELVYDTVFRFYRPDSNTRHFFKQNMLSAMRVTNIFEAEGDDEDKIMYILDVLGIFLDDLTTVSNYEYFMRLYDDAKPLLSKSL